MEDPAGGACAQSVRPRLDHSRAPAAGGRPRGSMSEARPRVSVLAACALSRRRSLGPRATPRGRPPWVRAAGRVSWDWVRRGRR
jgi:hypothetical protein